MDLGGSREGEGMGEREKCERPHQQAHRSEAEGLHAGQTSASAGQKQEISSDGPVLQRPGISVTRRRVVSLLSERIRRFSPTGSILGTPEQKMLARFSLRGNCVHNIPKACSNCENA